jgi:hypothetical protein
MVWERQQYDAESAEFPNASGIERARIQGRGREKTKGGRRSRRWWEESQRVGVQHGNDFEGVTRR